MRGPLPLNKTTKASGRRYANRGASGLVIHTHCTQVSDGEALKEAQAAAAQDHCPLVHCIRSFSYHWVALGDSLDALDTLAQ